MALKHEHCFTYDKVLKLKYNFTVGQFLNQRQAMGSGRLFSKGLRFQCFIDFRRIYNPVGYDRVFELNAQREFHKEK